MAICEIEKMPEYKKSASKKELIIADIQEAIDKGIKCFEFVGDEYNYNTLCAYGREVATRMFAAMARGKFYEIAKRKYPNERIYTRIGFERSFFEIRQQKEKDRVHIYMKINLENFDQRIEEAVDQERENQRIAKGRRI